MRVVQKFGGSSVADAESIQRVAKRIVDTLEQGNEVVVKLKLNWAAVAGTVTSAMTLAAAR